jgi:hypothetical protein
LAVKSLSGRAAIGGKARAFLNDSVVATSTSICDGRSARAHTTPPSVPTSPDCTPWAICGRSAARLSEGIAVTPSALAPVERKRRRESLRKTLRGTSIVMQSLFVGQQDARSGRFLTRFLHANRHPFRWKTL